MKASKITNIISSIGTLSNLIFEAYISSKQIKEKPKEMLNLTIFNVCIIVLTLFTFLPATWFYLNYFLLTYFEQNIGYTIIKSLMFISLINIGLLSISIIIIIMLKNKIIAKENIVASEVDPKSILISQIVSSISKKLFK